jgi:phosphoribosylamine---glycine ligase
MRILVIGGGGREHALVWKLAQSPRGPQLYCAPGNAGTAALAESVPIAVDQVEALRDFALRHAIDVTLVGPELPLVLGIVDAFEAAGLRILGPSRRAAQLEGSKAFTKDLLRRTGVPTADYATFDDHAAARRHLDAVGAPIVVKADGLAAGKGVTVCTTVDEARRAVDAAMHGGAFGDAGRRVVIEECLRGEEVSFMALTDGRTVVPLASSQDHKRLGDGDTGPNTGGMGAYSPAPLLTPALEETVMDEVMYPVVEGLAADGIPYRGLLYAGLMIDDGRPKVLEFNVRFGDPECQVLMARLRSDLIDLIEAVLDGFLVGCTPSWDPRPSAGVVLAAAGYPGEPVKGTPIRGLAGLEDWKDGVVFHAGTVRRGDEVVTGGGRVLTVTALGDDLAAAVAHAYAGVAHITFDGMHFRTDIGHRGLRPTARA